MVARLTHHRLGVYVARLCIIGFGTYVVALLVAVHDTPDPGLFGFGLVPTRPVLMATAFAGGAYVLADRIDALRVLWLSLLTISTFGRALSLVFVGLDDLTRAREIAAAGAYGVLFLAGLLSSLVLSADRILRR